MVALAGDALAAALGAGAVLLLVLAAYVVMRHARPQLRLDIGVRGWINLVRPPELTPEQQLELERERQRDAGA